MLAFEHTMPFFKRPPLHQANFNTVEFPQLYEFHSDMTIIHMSGYVQKHPIIFHNKGRNSASSLVHLLVTNIGIIHIYSLSQNRCYRVHTSCSFVLMFIKVMPKAKLCRSYESILAQKKKIKFLR